MILPAEAELERPVLDFLLSNTPFYLYTKLRVSPVTQKLANLNSTQELQELFALQTSKDVRSSADVTLAYVVLVALSLKHYGEAEPALRRIPVHLLDWGVAIRDICLAKSVSEVHQYVPPAIKVLPPSSTFSQSAYTTRSSSQIASQGQQ